MYYFGCIGQPGHYLWENESRKLWFGDLPEDFPRAWRFKESHGAEREYVQESRIAPNAYGEQGLASTQHCEKWTCVSFPDRTIDHRPNCVSAFLERGNLSYVEILRIAQIEFPNVIRRFDFEIKEGNVYE